MSNNTETMGTDTVDHQADKVRKLHGDESQDAGGREERREDWWSDRFNLGRNRLIPKAQYVSDVLDAAIGYITMPVSDETAAFVNDIALAYEDAGNHYAVIEFIDSFPAVAAAQLTKLASLEFTALDLSDRDNLSDAAGAFLERVMDQDLPMAKFRWAQTSAIAAKLEINTELDLTPLRERVTQELNREGQRIYDRFVKVEEKRQVTAEEREQARAARVAKLRASAA